MICHKCQQPFTPTGAEIASELGSIKSKKKARASRRNGKLGGRPVGSKSRKTTVSKSLRGALSLG